MDVKNLLIADLKPYEKNPRKNDNAVDAVANSIKQFGFKVPIVIDANNVIVCGHTRYKAAQQLGLESVPCVVADDLTPAQVKAFRLADNKVAELSSWDFRGLEFELNELKDVGLDMNNFGFHLADFESIDGFFEEVKPKGNSAETPKNKPTEPIAERQPSDVEVAEPTVEKIENTEPDEHSTESSNNEIKPNKVICPHCGKTFEL